EDTCRERLSAHASLAGFVAITGEDDAYFLPSSGCRRIQTETTKPMVVGEMVRDYGAVTDIRCVFPYQDDLTTALHESIPRIIAHLWPNRRLLQRRKRFGTPVENLSRFEWYEIRELYRDK